MYVYIYIKRDEKKYKNLLLKFNMEEMTMKVCEKRIYNYKGNKDKFRNNLIFEANRKF